LQTGEEEGPSLRPRRRKRRTEPSLMGREGKGVSTVPRRGWGCRRRRRSWRRWHGRCGDADEEAE
jgi:hypothetical protein